MPTSAQAGWTDDRVKALKALFADGVSPTRIARQIGKTRNSVIGKAYRLGIPRGSYKLAMASMTTERRVAVQARATLSGKAPVRLPTRAFRALPGSQPTRWEQRPAHGCRWPIDTADGSRACAVRTLHRYCGEHSRISREGLRP